MKWIVALLMIINVVVYLWASRHQNIVDETAISAKFDVNKEGMLMLSETGGLKQIGRITDSKQAVSALAGLEKKPTKGIISSGTTSQTIQQPTQQIADSAADSVSLVDKIPTESVQTSFHGITTCYQLGPFKKQSAWQVATQWMERNEIVFRRITSESRELQAVRVYLGPYQSAPSAESTIRLLKSRNIDYFVYPTENGLVRISLGYFTQQALAEKFLTRLHAINVQAKSEIEYRQLGPFNWLVIPIGSTKEKQVIVHNWAESAVELSQTDC